MKHMTCRQLGGACDVAIVGNTPEEMGQNSKAHVMELIARGDTSHSEAMLAMKNMTPEQLQAFMAEYRRNFDAAEEV